MMISFLIQGEQNHLSYYNCCEARTLWHSNCIFVSYFVINGRLDGEEADEDIIVGDVANIDKSKLIGASAESIAPMDDVLDTDVLDDVVPTDVLNDIEDAETVLGINNFEDDEDDYYVGREEDDYGDLDAYDDNEGVY